MLRSKATVALMRLKEIDRKYNIKSNESKRLPSNVSTESTPDDSSRSHGISSKEMNASVKPKLDVSNNELVSDLTSKEFAESTNTLKPQISVQIPKVYSKHGGSLSEKDESNESFEISTKSDISEEINSQESLNESLLITNNKKEPKKSSDDSTKRSNELPDTSISSKSAESSKSSKINFREENSIKSKSVKTITSDNSENISDFNNSKITERSINVTNRTNSEQNETVSKLSPPENEEIESNEESNNSSAESDASEEYENDTFEDISSSTILTKSNAERIRTVTISEEEIAVEESVRSGVKRIDIVPHKQSESSDKKRDNERKKQIVEIIAPKPMESTSECEIGLDEELSNYVKINEKIDDPSKLAPICLLKSTRDTPARKHGRRIRKHGRSKETSEKSREIDSMQDSNDDRTMENHSERNENLLVHEDSKLDVVSNSEKMESISGESLTREKNETEGEKDSFKKLEKSVKTDEKSSANESRSANLESISRETFLEEVPGKSVDATSMLRKLNRDAIEAISKRHRNYGSKGKSGKIQQCSNCGKFVKLPSGYSEALGKVTGDDNEVTSRENEDTTMRGKKNKKKRMKMKDSKSSKIRKTLTRAKIDEKHSRFDCKGMYRLRKEATIERLQKEREDIRNYLREFERTRLEFRIDEFPASPAFKPLEFPKIAAFDRPDVDDLGLKSANQITGLQERISTIRQWLKDQYILYRNYSDVVKKLNAKYVPASLEDAKKTIRQLQKTTIKTR